MEKKPDKNHKKCVFFSIKQKNNNKKRNGFYNGLMKQTNKQDKSNVFFAS